MKKNKVIQILFVATPNVEPYINTLAHAIDVHNVNHIVLINLKGIPTGVEIDFEHFRHMKLEKTIFELAEGTYSSFSKSSNRIEEFIIDNKDCYIALKKVLTNSIDIKTISYDFLSKQIAEIIEDYEQKGDCFIDLTGVPKRIALDIFMACASLGNERIVTFELKIQPSGVNTLYHKLEKNQYEYVVLPASETFLQSTESIIAMKNSKRFLVIIMLVLPPLAFAITNYLNKKQFNEPTSSQLIIFEIVCLSSVMILILDGWGIFTGRYLKKIFKF